jgi:hypothetical protein
MLAKYIVGHLFVLGMLGTDVAAAESLPTGVGAIAPYEFRLKSRNRSAIPQDVIEHSIAPDGAAVAENAWDFTKPETIPGFGTLPQGYGTGSLLPTFSGE